MGNVITDKDTLMSRNMSSIPPNAPSTLYAITTKLSNVKALPKKPPVKFSPVKQKQVSPSLNRETLLDATVTIERVSEILKTAAKTFNSIDISLIQPSYKAALDGELSVLSYQLYKTGLFAKIECIKIGNK